MPKDASKPIKLLIVDDSPLNLDQLLTILAGNYDLRVSVDGATALQFIATGFVPDLILLDIMMPDMDGYQVCRRLKDDPQTRAIPVIFLSALSSDEDQARGLEYGAVDYITKPFNADLVRRRIEVQLLLQAKQADLEQQVRQRTAELEQAVADAQAKEASLQESEKRLRLAQKVAQLGGWEFDCQTRELYWSEETFRIFERDPASFQPTLKGFFDCVYPEDRQLVEQTYHDSLERQDPYEVTYRVQTADGRIKFIQEKGENHFDALGRPVTTIGTAQDVTRAKELQQENDRAGRLAALGELAAGVAHEINNPNALVLYNSELLDGILTDLLPLIAEKLQPGNDQATFGGLSLSEALNEIPVLLPAINESAQRIKRIVNDLRDFARRELDDQNEAVDLNQLIETTMRLVTNPLKKATDHFSLHLHQNLPPVAGMTGRLEQVFINLLLNACQSLENSSQAISVSTDYDRQQQLVTAEIADQGRGMDEATLNRILEPFVTTRRDQGGTGLGLSVSDRIIKEHGGKMEFRSLVGQGTTVRVSLPLAQEVT